MMNGITHYILLITLLIYGSRAPAQNVKEGVAIFGSHHVVLLVPERATGLAAHVAPSTGFEIVGENLAVHPDMMPREGFSSGCLSQRT